MPQATVASMSTEGNLPPPAINASSQSINGSRGRTLPIGGLLSTIDVRHDGARPREKSAGTIARFVTSREGAFKEETAFLKVVRLPADGTPVEEPRGIVRAPHPEGDLSHATIVCARPWGTIEGAWARTSRATSSHSRLSMRSSTASSKWPDSSRTRAEAHRIPSISSGGSRAFHPYQEKGPEEGVITVYCLALTAFLGEVMLAVEHGEYLTGLCRVCELFRCLHCHGGEKGGLEEEICAHLHRDARKAPRRSSR